MLMNWPVESIRKGCKNTKTYDPRQRPDETFRYIDISGIDRVQKCIASTTVIIGADAPSRARKIVHAGDVLVSTVRPNLNAVAMVPPELDGHVASTGFCVLRARHKILHSQYLFYFTQYESFINQLVAQVRGANYPAVSDKIVKEAKIPLPAPSEQRRIVEILDQADALRKKRAEADQLSERILPALFYNMIGGQQANFVEVQSLIDDGILVVHKDGNYGSNYPRKTEFSEDGIPFLSAIHINEQGFADYNNVPRLNYAKAQTFPFGWVENGDVLLAHNATVGRVGFVENVDEPMLIGTSLTCYRVLPTLMEPLYLFAALRSDYFQNQLKAIMGQGTRNQVPITAQRKLLIPFASPESQQVISSQVAGLRCMLSAVNKVGWALDMLFETLMYRAFSGALTVEWREAHMTELLQEMEIQARELKLKETI